MVKLRKNVEFYGSDEELTWKIPAVGKSADELYEEKERKLYIDSVLKKHLSDREQAVIRLIIYEQYTQAETAKILGITQPTVNIYYKRALAKLKGILNNKNVCALCKNTNK